ncbi:hypothetical protein MPL1032_100312 [Mesorhizobium plurifarium]|uniref:Uncharacterized protein n=1 Tax=Mesorhizobium plurifarium TaxID=69974 RepID=A0A0K2VNW0_MESPL|nr:hypothetical protein MPL1032_100312 [Mesorhizobium plurifarium]
MDDHRCARQGHHGDDLQHQGRRQLPARHVCHRLHGEQRVEHEDALKPLTWRAVSSFVILGRSDASRPWNDEVEKALANLDGLRHASACLRPRSLALVRRLLPSGLAACLSPSPPGTSTPCACACRSSSGS